MKFLVVFVFVCFAAVNALDKEFVEKFMNKMQEVGIKCQAETKASADDMTDLMERRIPASHEGKCMIFCFHKHFQMQNEDGSMSPDGIKAFDPIKENDANVYDIMVKAYNSCFSSVGDDSDPCIKAANFADCAMKEAKALGLDDSIMQ